MGLGDLFGSKNNEPIRGDVTLQTLEPGDVVMLWDGTASVVDSILDCAEQLGDRAVSWRWVFLDGGNLLEVAPTGVALYEKTEVFPQGSTNFYKLVAEPEAGGVLKSFEERVRDGSVASNPISFTYQRRRYQVRSTGTFVADRKGKPLAAEVWADVTANPGDNVYFKMQTQAPIRSERAIVSGQAGQEEVLGVWTTHIAFLRGRHLDNADIRGLYSKS